MSPPLHVPKPALTKWRPSSDPAVMARDEETVVVPEPRHIHRENAVAGAAAENQHRADGHLHSAAVKQRHTAVDDGRAIGRLVENSLVAEDRRTGRRRDAGGSFDVQDRARGIVKDRAIV